MSTNITQDLMALDYSWTVGSHNITVKAVNGDISSAASTSVSYVVYRCTQILTRCTSSYAKTVLSAGQSITITLTGTAGRQFKNAADVDVTMENSVEGDIFIEGIQTSEVTVTIAHVRGNVTVDATANFYEVTFSTVYPGLDCWHQFEYNLNDGNGYVTMPTSSQTITTDAQYLQIRLWRDSGTTSSISGVMTVGGVATTITSVTADTVPQESSMLTLNGDATITFSAAYLRFSDSGSSHTFCTWTQFDQEYEAHETLSTTVTPNANCTLTGATVVISVGGNTRTVNDDGSQVYVLNADGTATINIKYFLGDATQGFTIQITGILNSLDAPTISLSNGVLTINTVDNAASYHIYDGSTDLGPVFS